jgi:hypothetical protein
MDSNRKTSLIFGLFFAGTFVFSIPALFFYGPLLSDPDWVLGGGWQARVSVGALFEILLVICNVATAIVLFPIAKRTSEAAALGYVAVPHRGVHDHPHGRREPPVVATLRTAFVPGVDAEAFSLAGRSLLAFHDWTFLLGPQFCAGFGNGLLLGYLMYRSASSRGVWPYSPCRRAARVS